MNIYNIPYTYLIKCVPENLYYYGVRYAKDCNPNEFFVKYFTSSEEVARLILKYGLDNFVFEIRRTFKNTNSARKWENKVLKRIKAAQRSDFINKCNGKAPSNEKEIRDLIIKTFIIRYGVDNPSKCPEIIAKIVDYWNSLSVEEKQNINNKRIDTCILKYDKPNVMQVKEIKEKGKKTNLSKYGVEYSGQQIVTCPWCLKTGGKTGFDAFHFNFCKENPNRIVREKKLYTCLHCGLASENKSNMDRYHFDNCKLSSNYKQKEKILKQCPHCDKEGSGGNMTRYHFDNCKFK